MSKATYLAFAVLLATLGLSGCGGGGAEENVSGSTAAGAAAPSVPTGLTVTPVSPSQINLSWNAATGGAGLTAAAGSDPVTGYNVYRDGSQIAAVGTTTYEDTGLEPSTDYSYSVEAVSASGKTSGKSSSARGRTKDRDTISPSTPTGLTATATSSSQIILAWAASTDDVGVTGYDVYRDGTQIAALGAITTFQNTGLAASATYSYAVQAFDAARNVSAQSSSVSATTQAITTDTTAPSTPSGLTAMAVSSSQISLSWTAATDNVGVTGYSVYRGGIQIATVGPVTTFQNTGLTASTAYSYTVRAFDAVGNQSGQSMAASATTLASSGVISLSLVPSRTSGVGPLAVFFDATGTTSPSTTRPFHDLEYRWDFGDPAGGATWSKGSRVGASKNSATGPVAAHVYETAGTYTVTLTVTDGTNTGTTTATITVDDPNVTFANTNTRCFSTSGVFAGCPANAQTIPTDDFDAALTAHKGSGRRLLFRGGETFGANATVRIPSNMTLGSFGTGKAIIRADANVSLIVPESTASDIRIVDLDVNSNGQSAATVGAGFPSSSVKQLLFLRTTLRNNGAGLGVQFTNNLNVNPIQDGNFLWDQFAFVDCEVLDFDSYGILIEASRFALLGTNIVGVQSEHIFRAHYIKKSVISHNFMGDGSVGKHVIKLAGPEFGVSSSYNEQIVISDNKFDGDETGWPVAIGPQNSARDERVRDFIVERNWFMSSVLVNSAADTHITIWAQRGTVRNNIIDSSRGAAQNGNHRGIHVDRRGVEPAPDDIRIYNNTGYKSDSTNSYTMVSLAQGTNIVVKNNLASAPNQGTKNVLVDNATGTIKSNNVITDTPGWISGSPSNPAEFALTSGSTARDAGAAVPVFSDFFRQSRPQNSQFDIGAWEFQP